MEKVFLNMVLINILIISNGMCLERNHLYQCSSVSRQQVMVKDWQTSSLHFSIYTALSNHVFEQEDFKKVFYKQWSIYGKLVFAEKTFEARKAFLENQRYYGELVLQQSTISSARDLPYLYLIFFKTPEETRCLMMSYIKRGDSKFQEPLTPDEQNKSFYESFLKYEDFGQHLHSLPY